MNKGFKTWDEVEKELKITQEQEAEIQLEMDIIKATIEARKKSMLTQRANNSQNRKKRKFAKGINTYETIVFNGVYFESSTTERQ